MSGFNACTFTENVGMFSLSLILSKMIHGRV